MTKLITKLRFTSPLSAGLTSREWDWKSSFHNNKFYHKLAHYVMYLFSGYFFMSTVVSADKREASTISVFMFLTHKSSDSCQLTLQKRFHRRLPCKVLTLFSYGLTALFLGNRALFLFNSVERMFHLATPVLTCF